MKKFLTVLLALFLTAQVFAYNPLNTSVEKMYSEVGKALKHNVEEYEKNIIDTTYLYYYKQCDGKWNKDVWNDAVSKSIELCNNKAAVNASKAGEFGEKLLQALIVTGEDAWHGLSNWMDKKSKEYQDRHEK